MPSGTRKMVRALRMGTPTSERSYYSGAEIIPEFHGFLTAQRRLGRKHVYVSLQNVKGNEANRTKTIKSLMYTYQGSCFGRLKT